MYILTQDGTQMVNLSQMKNIEIREKNRSSSYFVLVACDLDNSLHVIGEFLGEENAKGALFKIYEQMSWNDKALYVPD